VVEGPGDRLEGALQTRADEQAWDKFVELAAPRAVLEFGTGSGVFSKQLAEKVDWFTTLDIREPAVATPGFRRLSVWDDEEEILTLIRGAPRPFVLFCDNGNKRLEVAKYAPALRVGDYLAVHDLGVEIWERDVPANFARVHAGGLTGFFRKMRRDPLLDAIRRRIRFLRRRLRLRTRLRRLARL
jgi:hypothetical protein